MKILEIEILFGIQEMAKFWEIEKYHIKYQEIVFKLKISYKCHKTEDRKVKVKAKGSKHYLIVNMLRNQDLRKPEKIPKICRLFVGVFFSI